MHSYRLNSEVNEIEGVYQIKTDLPFPVKFVSNYLIKIDEDTNILIDAGFNFSNWRKTFFAALKTINISPKDIDYCLVTHEHIEHIGLLQKLKELNPNIQIVMHEITHENIQWQTDVNNRQEIKNSAKDLAKEMVQYGMSETQGKRVVDFFMIWTKLLPYQKPDKIVKDLDEISCGTRDLQIIWTPGHSLGHMCILDKKNQHLFSGDHILSRITPHVGIFTRSPRLKEIIEFDNMLDLFLKSLEKVNKLNTKIIFPGHQEIIYDVSDRISAMKEHHQKRLKEVLEVIRNNPMTPLQISLLHFGENLDEMNRYMALNEVLSHLIYLEKQDKVKRIEKNGKILFTS